MRSFFVAATVLLLLVASVLPAAAQAESQVYVIHGIPDAEVDVWVDGEPLLEGFAPGTITDPLTLAAGTYDVEVFEAGADPDEAEPLISASPEVPEGANLSVVAHLDGDGNPTLGAFVNDVGELGGDQARLTARHTAAAPEVDVRADGDALFEGVANGGEGTVEVPAGTYSADIVLAGEDDPVIGPADVNLQGGTLTAVYAIGSADEGTLDLLVQTIAVTPDGVPAGSGGLAAQTSSAWTPVMLSLGLLLVAVSAMSLAHRRAGAARPTA